MAKAIEEERSHSAAPARTSASRELVSLTPTEYIKREDALSIIALRKPATLFAFTAFGILLLSSIVIVFLQGFQTAGFHLESRFFDWLGPAILGQVATIALIIYKSVFGKKHLNIT